MAWGSSTFSHIQQKGEKYDYVKCDSTSVDLHHSLLKNIVNVTGEILK